MEDKKFCKFCGEQIDKNCAVCPKCGRQLEMIKAEQEEKNEVSNNDINTNSKFYEQTWFMWAMLLFFAPVGIFFMWKFHPEMKKKTKIILSIVFALFFIIAMTIYSGDSSSIVENGESNGEIETKKELTEDKKMLQQIVSLFDEKLAFDTGSYIKDEIPTGEYAFVKFSGSGSYYCEKDAGGNIIDNENFDSFGYVKVHASGNLETNGVLINVTAFEKLGVSGAKEIYEKLNKQTNYNQGGYYKVGTDIEAGSYVIESIGGNGYYSINSGPVSGSEIIDNDFFNGKASVSLSNGQYIEVSRATINKSN